jgi:hypothetical protein
MIADLPCQLSQPSADSEDVTVKNPNVSLGETQTWNILINIMEFSNIYKLIFQ